MNKQTKITILIVLIIALLFSLGLVVLIQPYWEGIKPAWLSSDQNTDRILDKLDEIHEDTGEVDYAPFSVHSDFKMSVFARDLTNPRVMIFDAIGRIIVSEPSEGRVMVLDEESDQVLIEGLNKPHGLAMKDGKLYVAETGQIMRYDYDVESISLSNGQVIMDLPAGGRHWSRTIAFGPDDHLYISVGSSCNICEETDWRRIKILRYNIDTQVLEVYGDGLRNSVFFDWHPLTGDMYATEMGRDMLGDDLPPDEINLVQAGKHYGYPYCYGKNEVDPEFGDPPQCLNKEESFYDFVAHEAPLGIDFFENDIIVALHGSWNRAEPVGYEVIRLLEGSKYQKREVIMTGWLQEDGTSIGRPAGVLVDDKRGIIYVSDDKEGVIYQLEKSR